MFHELGWEEEMLAAEVFYEPPRSLADPADNHRRVPLITQEQAYANHGTHEDQVAAVDGGGGTPGPRGPRASGLLAMGWTDGL